MKYTVSNTINSPRENVIAKFTAPNNAFEWMEGLQKINVISGEPYKKGTITEYHFKHKDKDMVIRETILEENLPYQIRFAYSSKMGYNEVELKFEVASDQSVHQINNSYFKFKGIMKLMAFLGKGTFKKHSLKLLNDFKDYAEK